MLRTYVQTGRRTEEDKTTLCAISIRQWMLPPCLLLCAGHRLQPIVHPQPFLWASTCSAEAPWCLSHGGTLLGVDPPHFTHLGVDPSRLTHHQQQHGLSLRGTSGLQ